MSQRVHSKEALIYLNIGVGILPHPCICRVVLLFSRSEAQELIVNVNEFIGIKTSPESRFASQIKHDQISTSDLQKPQQTCQGCVDDFST